MVVAILKIGQTHEAAHHRDHSGKSRPGYGWAFVKYLAIPDEYRGQGLGSRLIQEAETLARARGYIGVWLDTFEFQARPFYEKLGYQVFGELEGGPNAIPRYFLKKRF
nr:GNAT family N-acetyltransferase [Rhizobium herbae]